MRENNRNLIRWFSRPFVSNKREAIQELILDLSDKSNEGVAEVVEAYSNKRNVLLSKSYKLPNPAPPQQLQHLQQIFNIDPNDIVYSQIDSYISSRIFSEVNSNSNITK